MPPRKARPRERAAPRAPKAPKCSYIENGARCARDGSGNPPICAAHAIVLQTAAARADTVGAVFGVVADFFSGRPVSRDQLRQGFTDLLGNLVIRFDGWQPSQGATGTAPIPGRPPPPPGRQAPPPRRVSPEEAQARSLLGFSMIDVLDEATIKHRQRDLARKHHPDRGGSLATMQKINAAADLLLSTLAQNP